MKADRGGRKRRKWMVTVGEGDRNRWKNEDRVISDTILTWKILKMTHACDCVYEEIRDNMYQTWKCTWRYIK